MIENEFKIMLTKAQYEAIHGMFAWDRELEQVNSYYDDAAQTCSGRHITVRVRSVSGRFLLQVKLPAQETQNGAVSRVELEKELTGIPQTISGSELEQLSGAAGIPDVAYLGTLSTFRSVKHFPGAEIDLDRSEYFGKTDYELEVEYTDEAAAEKLISDIAEVVDIDRETPVTGKITRFLAEYAKTR